MKQRLLSDCVSRESTVRLAIQLLEKGGAIMIVGVPRIQITFSNSPRRSILSSTLFTCPIVPGRVTPSPIKMLIGK